MVLLWSPDILWNRIGVAVGIPANPGINFAKNPSVLLNVPSPAPTAFFSVACVVFVPALSFVYLLTLLNQVASNCIFKSRMSIFFPVYR